MLSRWADEPMSRWANTVSGADADAVTPSSNKSYTRQSVPSSLGRLFLRIENNVIYCDSQFKLLTKCTSAQINFYGYNFWGTTFWDTIFWDAISGGTIFLGYNLMLVQAVFPDDISPILTLEVSPLSFFSYPNHTSKKRVMWEWWLFWQKNWQKIWSKNGLKRPKIA